MRKLLGTQEQNRKAYYFAIRYGAEVSTTAERLTEAMNDRQVDQSTLAQAIGVTQGTISLILRGKTRQSKYLPEIAIELGVSYDWLMGRAVDKFADSPVDLLVTPDERDLIEQLRALPFPQRNALEKVATGLFSAHLRAQEPWASLPSEPALARMFEGLLRAMDRAAPLDEQARLLAQRLPIGLSQLRDLLPAAPAADASTPAPSRATPAPAQH